MARRAELIKTLPSGRITTLKPRNIAAKRTVYTAAVTVSGEIRVDDPRRPDVRALLERHLTFALSTTPPEHSFALDVDALLDPAITFCGYRASGELLGVGALKRLDAEHAEIKSMHTADAARGRGVGRAMLNHLLGLARDHGYRRVYLETGTMIEFEPARALYASAGFVACGPFADYQPSEDNFFMTLVLDAVAT
jgi:putative acetyltransferase